MPLECIKVPSFMGLRGVVKTRGHDFWIGCLAGVTEDELPDKMVSFQVEKELAGDIFSHCYYQASDDIKGTTNSIIDEFGLGLRKKRTTSLSVPGCVYVLVNKAGPTLLSQRRATLGNTDKALSSEERLRRTHLQFCTATEESALRLEAQKYKRHFWLTCFIDHDVQAAQKRVVTMTVKGSNASERFSHCILLEVRDCHAVTERLTMICGLGLRAGSVRSRTGPGCVVLLVDRFSAPERKLAKEDVNRTKTETAPILHIKKENAYASSQNLPMDRSAAPGQALQRVAASNVFPHPLPVCPPRTSLAPARAPANPAPQRERRKQEVNYLTPEPKKRKLEVIGSTAPTPGTVPMLPLSVQGGGSSTAVDADYDADGERYFKQVCILEKKMDMLLPALPSDQLSTPFVQAHLENYMTLPAGRLHKFKNEIGRIWRAYICKQTPDPA